MQKLVCKCTDECVDHLVGCVGSIVSVEVIWIELKWFRWVSLGVFIFLIETQLFDFFYYLACFLVI